MSAHPHRRLNPLTGDWVLVSPHRTLRPWQGQVETVAAPTPVAYDPQCYLCPGNTRSGGHINPSYEATFVFDNDFPAMKTEAAGAAENTADLLVSEPERGVCRVVCYSPNHSLTFAQMSPAAILPVVKQWTAQYLELGAIPWIRSVQIFENRGEMMGSSNPHPHGQIWASESVPNELRKEVEAQRAFFEKHNDQLLMRYLATELAAKERVVFENPSFVVVAPYWAVWPFETLILPRRHVTALDQLQGDEPRHLAGTLSLLTALYDRLFAAPFPYSMGLHQRPTDGDAHAAFTFHIHFYPPLLRSATIRKFMVGFEMMGGPQRDLTPETAAAMLTRGLPLPRETS